MEGMDQQPRLYALLEILLLLFSCIWSYIKDKVFAAPNADVKELKARIQNAVCAVAKPMLKELKHCLAIPYWYWLRRMIL